MTHMNLKNIEITIGQQKQIWKGLNMKKIILNMLIIF